MSEAVVAREVAERCRRDVLARDEQRGAALAEIQAHVAQHGVTLAEHTAVLNAIRAGGDTTKLIAKVVTGLSAVATVLGAYLAASKPSPEQERKAAARVVAEAVRELREEDARRVDAVMSEVRQALDRVETRAEKRRGGTSGSGEEGARAPPGR